MSTTGKEFLEELSELHQSLSPLKERYIQMRRILDKVLKWYTKNENLQFPDLYSRLVFACEHGHFSPKEQLDIHMMRKNAHLVLMNKLEPAETMYQHDFAALIQSTEKLTKADIPLKIRELLIEYQQIQEDEEKTYIPESETIALIRFYVQDAGEGFFLGQADETDVLSCKVLYDSENSPFRESLRLVRPGQIMHLVDCQVTGNEISPQIFITDPDYLLDISSVSECIREYGMHPYFYYLNRLQTKETSTPILIGNMANHFLDVFVHAPRERTISFNDTMRDIFKMYPFDISVNAELDDTERKAKFFEDSRKQFEHIQHVVREVFPQQNIDVSNAVLEPSFICAQLGIQGRLDFLSLSDDNTVVIELKSGKAPFPESRTELVADNHRAQLFLYQIVIQKVLGVKFKDIHSYLLYSRYADPKANLRMVRPYLDGVKTILDIRNQIVALERRNAEDEHYFEKMIQHLSPGILINRSGQNERFLQQFIVPQIEAFRKPFQGANALELAYFYSFYHFVTKEQFIAKAGVTHYEQSTGHASIWLSEVDDKLESGEILLDLKIEENLSDQPVPTIRLNIPEYDDSFLPNFRKGDIVILYQRDTPDDNVTNKQIFRGSIINISHKEVTIRLRNSQSNTQFLPTDSLYAIEHDFMDASFGSMYRGLYCFLNANQERKDLLLHQRTLETDTSITLKKEHLNNDIQIIVEKSKQAKDYFLLVGPPGTGKTSVALKSMVDEFYSEPDTNILLLSYTNRAVDEICESITQITPGIEYIRIGSEFSTDNRFHHRLLQNVIKDHSKREQVKDTLMRCRVFVGTVASVSGKSELFRMKKFQVAIIDEASQILEPQLLGILTMKHHSNQNAIGKFIMIGDHKQLPAIVVQSPESSLAGNPLLNEAGITDRRISLFERLYRYHQHDTDSPHWSMLKKQGRMHPEIADFANQAFYDGQLDIVPTPHQSESLSWVSFDKENIWQHFITEKRTAFFTSIKVPEDKSFKINSDEVRITILLLQNIFALYQSNGQTFDPITSVGVITPYRSQIALIRKAIHQLQIPELEKITVDTVERYQGSQRDIIIYSFCVNHISQLELLSNHFIENEKIIDRKLNVALTRARKQMFIIGNPFFLSQDSIFSAMMKHYRERESYFSQ